MYQSMKLLSKMYTKKLFCRTFHLKLIFARKANLDSKMGKYDSPPPSLKMFSIHCNKNSLSF